MATIEQLYDALKNADAAGDHAAATSLANAIRERKAVGTTPQGDGLAANVGAGLLDAGYGVVSAPVEIPRGVVNNLTQQPNNWLSQAVDAVNPLKGVFDVTRAAAGALNVPAVPDNVVGGSRWLKEQGAKIGITNPDTIKAVSLPEKAIRGGTELATLALAPELLATKLGKMGFAEDTAASLANFLGAGQTPAGIAKNVATNFASGAGAAVAQDVAPDNLKPLAALAGAVVGGAGAHGFGKAAEMGATKVGQYFDPMRGTEGVERAAGRKLAEGLGGAQDAVAAIDAVPAPVSGERQTLAQSLVNTPLDRKAANMQAAANRVDDTAYQALIADQQKARAEALQRVRQTGGAEDMAPALEAHAKRIEDVTNKIDEKVQTVGAKVAADLNAGRIDVTTAGEQIQPLLLAQRKATTEAEGALHDLVDPNKTLEVTVGDLPTVHKTLVKDKSKLSEPVSATEAHINDLVGNLPPKVMYSDMLALKRYIGKAMSDAGQGTTEHGRLSQYYKAANESLQAPALNIAKQEAKAVKAGELAPEDTFLSKVREITDELDRRAASFGTDVAGDGTAIGGTPPTSLGAVGTARGAGSGLADVARGEGLPATGGLNPADTGFAQRVAPNDAPRSDLTAPADPAVAAQLSDAVAKGLDASPGAALDTSIGQRLLASVNDAAFDTGVGERLRAANAATIDRIQTFDNKTLKPITKAGRTPGSYEMLASKVPDQIFQKGPIGAEKVQLYRNAVGDEAALETLQGPAIDKALRFAERADGTIDPKKLSTWRKDHAGALSAFPAIDARLANASTTLETAGEVAAARRAKVTQAQKGIAAKLAGKTDPEELTAEVGKIFSRADSVPQMQKLRRALRGNVDAQAGLQKAVVDHLVNKTKLVDQTGAGADGLAHKVLRKFLDENEETLKAAGFTHPEVENMRALADEAGRAAQALANAKKAPNVAEQTIEAVMNFGTGPKAGLPSLLARIMVRGALHSAPAFFGGPFLGVSTLIGSTVLNLMRSKGLRNIEDLYREALLDPALARKLLIKVTPKNIKPAVNAFRQQLVRSTLGGTAAGLMNPEEPR